MTDYPLLRASLAPQYAGLPQHQLDQLVRQIYGPQASAEAVEGMFDDIGRGLKNAARGVGDFAQRAAPMVAKALPGAATGAASGAAFGPWGALIGAGAGLAGGLLSQSSNKSARSVGGAINTAGNLVSTVRGGGPTGALGSLSSVASGALGVTAGGQRALGSMRAGRNGLSGGGASILAALLARPELAHSLFASLMGSSGRPNISIGNQQVPVSQILSALGNVANRAAHEAAEHEEGAEKTPEYAELAAETLGIDPEDSEGRTDALLTLLALTPSMWMNRPSPVQVQINPNDPYFPAGESDWATELWLTEDDSESLHHEYFENGANGRETWVGDSLEQEDWGAEDSGNELWDEDEYASEEITYV